jgi:hypothetical protein
VNLCLHVREHNLRTGYNLASCQISCLNNHCYKMCKSIQCHYCMTVNQDTQKLECPLNNQGPLPELWRQRGGVTMKLGKGACLSHGLWLPTCWKFPRGGRLCNEDNLEETWVCYYYWLQAQSSLVCCMGYHFSAPNALFKKVIIPDTLLPFC